MWLFFSTTPLRLPDRGRQATTLTAWCLENAANIGVRSLVPAFNTVLIRSNRQVFVTPPSRPSSTVIASSRWGRSIDGEITARQTPECAREPTRT